MSLDLGNVTPARERALVQLLRWTRVRVGQGMYDDERAAVSPAGADWLMRHGLAVVVEPKLLHATESAYRVGRERAIPTSSGQPMPDPSPHRQKDGPLSP